MDREGNGTTRGKYQITLTQGERENSTHESFLAQQGLRERTFLMQNNSATH